MILSSSSRYFNCCCSFIESCPTLCDCSTTGPRSLRVSHSLLKYMSIELVMPSNHLILYHHLLLLSSIFPSVMVFSRVGSLNQFGKILEFQLQHGCFRSISRVGFLEDWLAGSVCRSRDPLRIFSSITVWRHKFFSSQPSLDSNSHIFTWLMDKW